MRFSIVRDKSCRHRWKLTAPNGDVVGCSSMSFPTELDCQVNCEIVFDGLHQNKEKWHTLREPE